MNSRQRRKERRRRTCRNCRDSAYHCPASGCNGYTEEDGWCDCEVYYPLFMKYKKFPHLHA